jgi:GNAT superfamily N-acetyltransferase
VISLRVADDNDVESIVAVVESAYRGDASRAGWTTEADLLDGQRTDVDAVRAAIQIGDILVVELHDRIVACCLVEPHADNVAYFGMFAVTPPLQGDGIGSQLLDAAEAHVRDRWGATLVEMTVIGQRSELIAWYERRGYRRTGAIRPFPYGDERYGRPRRDDLRFVVLAKAL